MERLKNMAEGTNNPEGTNIHRRADITPDLKALATSPEIQQPPSLLEQKTARPSDKTVSDFTAKMITNEDLYNYLASQQLWPKNFDPSDKSQCSTMSIVGPYEIYYDNDDRIVARKLKGGPEEVSMQNSKVFFYLSQQQTHPKPGVDLSRCKQSQEGPYVIYTDPKTHEVVARMLFLPVSGGAEGDPESPVGRRELGEDEEWIRAVSPTAGEIVFAWPKRDEDKVYKMREILLYLEKTSGGDEGGVMKQALQELVLVINALMVDSKNEGKRSLGGQMYTELNARVTNHSAYMSFISEATDGEKIHGVVKNVTASTLNFFFHNPLFWQAFLAYDQNSQEYLKASRTGAIGKFSRDLQEKLLKRIDMEELRTQTEKEIEDENRLRPEKSKLTSEGLEKEFDKRFNKKRAFISQEIESVQINAERLWQITLRRAAKEELVHKDLLTPATEEDKKKGEVDFLGTLNGGNFAANRGINFVSVLYKQISKWKLSPEQVHLMDNVDLGFKEFFSGFPGTVQDHWKKILQDQYSRRTNEPLTPKEAERKATENSVKITEILTGVKAIEKVKNGKISYEWPERDINISNFRWSPESWDPDKINGDDEDTDKGRALKDKKEKWTNERKEILTILEEAFPADPRRVRIPSLDFSELYGYSPFSSWGFFDVNRPDAFRKALTEDPEKGLIRNPTEENLFALGGVIDIRWDDKAQLLINTIHFLEKHNRDRELGRNNYNFVASNALLLNALAKRFISKDQVGEVDVKAFGIRRFLILWYFFNIFEFFKGIFSKSLEQALKPSK